VQFKARISRDTVTLLTVPDGTMKKGFVKRLPAVLAKRPKAFVEKFLGYDKGDLDSGTEVFTIEKSKSGQYVVGEVSFGNRSGKKYDGPDEVVYKTKILINRNNGLGIRLCFLPDELVGKRVDVY